MVDIETLHKGTIKKLEPNIYHQGTWRSIEVLAYRDGEWWNGETTLDVEIGAYTTWYADPSTSVMLHYQTLDNTPVQCLIRKQGELNWQTVSLFADKSFPFTTKRVRWFKAENLEPNTTYETRLKYHEQIHKFKTMPSTFSRKLNFLVTSDQMGSVTAFQNEAPQGFQTMHDNSIDALILAGDGVHDNGVEFNNWEVFWENYFNAVQNTGYMIPILYALGNHDGAVGDITGGALWDYYGANKEHVIFQYNFFSNLTDVGYGAIDISDYMSLIFLNSGHTEPVTGTQLTWLQSALSARKGKVIFPFFHVGPYPGWYGYDGTCKPIRDSWTPLFTQNGVKVAATGHEHLSLVTKKVTGDNLDSNGVVYIGQGLGMGNVTRGTKITQDTWYVDYLSTDTKDFDVVEFAPDGSVNVKQIGLTGTVLYSNTL